MEKLGYVYILSSGFKHLYIRVTSNLERRIRQHQNGAYAAAFTQRYNIKQLVYFERFPLMPEALAREKQLKRWSRIKKIRLIVATNPDWRDLGLDGDTPIEPFSGKLNPSRRFAPNTTGVSPLRDGEPLLPSR